VRITSPIVRGSGAIIVHSALEKGIPGYHLSPYSARWEYFPLMLPFVSRSDADIIHCTPECAAFVVARQKPLVVTFHNYVLDSFMRRYSTPVQRLHYRTDLLWSYRRAVRKASVITAVSEATAELVRQYLSPDISVQVIRNGVDTIAFHPDESTSFRKTIRVLFSGNPCRRKGADLLPEIARRLDPGIAICVTGGLRGVPMSYTSNNIEIIDKVAYSDMPDLYRSADILLMPTVREGLSLAVLEAMASGLPVVATNCSSLPEQIDHGKGGFLCTLGDVDDFVNKINQLATSRALRQRMGKYNRDKVIKNFTLTRMLSEYKKLFQQFT